MSKIVFNSISKTPEPFPFSKFDHELDLKEMKLSYRTCDTYSDRSCSLGINLNGTHYPIADIKLYHSGKTFNYEQTFVSAELLLLEIVNRFNSFVPKGQQVLDLTKKVNHV